MDYANTTNVEFIVDPKVLFHGWLIFSYLHLSWSSDCQGSVQFGSLTTLWHDSMSRQKNSILINKHALNHEPVPLKHCRFSGGVFLLLLCLFCGGGGRGFGSEIEHYFSSTKVMRPMFVTMEGLHIWRNFWAWKFIVFKVMLHTSPFKKFLLMWLFVCLFF